ncbi:decapping nuclease DXO homolog [Bactrocera neohumeralis]|uniref:decapping nuclease DXO homolog n=1 Tax=Bactrocera neohumeralis TaxID=98809 RepID=UPI002165E91F|nr:decapping nuclease DXO homolog [Bactrocera neohumeralis]
MATAANNNGYEVLIELQASVVKDENSSPPFYLSRPKIQKLYAYQRFQANSNDVRLPYFIEPRSYPIDLNKGFEKFIFRQLADFSKMLETTQKFIVDSEENVLQPYRSENPETHQSLKTEDDESYQQRQNSKRKLVLSNRGCLSNIMIIPYRLVASKYNDKTIFATRYCGVLHISDYRYDNDTSRINTYHSKFQQTCFSDDPDLIPDTDEPVNENDYIRGIFHTNLKEFDLIYSGELSGIVSNHKIDDMQNMENINKLQFISTKLLWNSDHSNFWKHPKCLNWWATLYLANTSDLCVGLKDRDGVIRTPLQRKPVKDLPKDQSWKPKICIRFLLTMLELIEKNMSSVNCPYTVYEFVYDSFAKCIKLKKHIGKTEYSFLNEEYIERCRKQTSVSC